MPLSFEDDTNNDDEGMIGKILKIVRAVNKENQTGIQENRDKIDGLQDKLTETQDQIKQLESRLIESFTKLIEEKLSWKANKGIDTRKDIWFLDNQNYNQNIYVWI